MKRKMFLFSLCLCICFSAMAQADDDFSAAFANKRGVYLLPQAGDFALGIDATPVLRYMGNFFSSSLNPAPQFNGVNGVNQTIFGKYFLQDNRAIRGRLTIGMSNYVDKYAVPDDEAIADEIAAGNTPDPYLYTKLTDIKRESNTFAELGIGYEFRRGNGRVQGFFGGEVFAGIEVGKTKYEYANPIEDTTPWTWPWPSMMSAGYTDYINGILCRVTENKAGRISYAGLGAFAGVEYFFAPQMSIGGEFGLGFSFSYSGQNKVTGEGWDSAGDVTTQSKQGTGWGTEMQLNTYPSGRITLMFHF